MSLQHFTACLAVWTKISWEHPWYQIKFGQILAQLTKNLFLALFCRLEASSTLFYNLDKKTIFSTPSTEQKPQTHLYWFLTNSGRVVNWKGYWKLFKHYPWLHRLVDPVSQSNDFKSQNIYSKRVLSLMY